MTVSRRNLLATGAALMAASGVQASVQASAAEAAPAAMAKTAPGGTQRMRIEQSHLGICVSDLERSVRFYRDGLGFEEGPSFAIDYPISEMSGDVHLTSKFLHSGDLRIELLAFRSPAAFGTPSAHRNQRGLTHLSFSVDDLDGVAAQAVAHGGTIIPGTRSTPEGRIHIIFLADPDGTRIELMRHAPGQKWPWY